MMMPRAMMTALVVGLVSAQPGLAGVDQTNHWGWGENVGWLNWRHNAPERGGAAIIRGTHMAGFVWGENIGWINLGDGTPADGVNYANVDGTDFGVNIDQATCELDGFAWGENVGWINFGGGALAMPPEPARLDEIDGRLRGFVWGENIGWINLSDDEWFVGVTDPADFDGDGVVGIAELLTVLTNWGPCPARPDTCLGDVKGDGAVGFEDLLCVLVAWG